MSTPIDGVLRDTRPPQVIAAYQALQGPRQPTHCGRRTRAGQPCEAPTPRLMRSCRAHATTAELSTADAERARLTAVLAAWEATLTPACHEWPVTEQDLAAADTLASIVDPLDAARQTCNVLWSWQRGRCAVCGHHATAVDHDHDTALIRGWLCRHCNHVEGWTTGGDHVRYRARPPATMLGIRVRYHSPVFGLAQPGRVA